MRRHLWSGSQWLFALSAARIFVPVLPRLSTLPGLDAKAQAVKQALKREAVRRRADDAPEDIVMGAEADLVGAFVDLVRFELQSGHAEVAVARIQGSLELNFFSPPDLKGTHALHWSWQTFDP